MSCALLSPCGMYRYRLERSGLVPFSPPKWHALTGGTVAFFGINPSTADATEDDATVRKWTGFCRRWGVERFIVGNAFAYRSTDVRGVRRHYIERLGGGGHGLLAAQNDIEVAHWAAIAADADVIIPCWGNSDKVPAQIRGRLAFLSDVLRKQGKPMLCFGRTKSGDPLHPLMLGYDTALEVY